MSSLWSPDLFDIDEYVPGEQPKDKKYIKLNTNENPYPPSERVLEAIIAAAGDGLRLYPDPNCSELTEAAALACGVKPEQVFMGNGSDEVLAMCFRAFFTGRGVLRMPDISYSFYPVYAKLYGINCDIVALSDDLSIPVEKFFNSQAGVVIANPNAPTGIALPAAEIGRIAENNPGCVVLCDEAYVDFGAESAVPLISKYNNLLIVRTLSKSASLAGLRIGWAIGDEKLIKGLNKVKNSINSYTLDSLAQAGAAAAFKDSSYISACCAKVAQTREHTSERLKKLGFELTDSKSNFVFARHSTASAETLFSALRQNGVLVRYFKTPRISDRLRISVGTEEDMDILIAVLERILESL
ncbi:MAG: histidinol-phosphate transaminase [Clostridiales bacterium]|nr:histidinol-phosphate transaminase [Clostridiales bacterium]